MRFKAQTLKLFTASTKNGLRLKTEATGLKVHLMKIIKVQSEQRTNKGLVSINEIKI